MHIVWYILGKFFPCLHACKHSAVKAIEVNSTIPVETDINKESGSMLLLQLPFYKC